MGKSRKYDLKKRKSYRNRFSDKKINTKIEKKVSAMINRGIAKNREKLIHGNNVLATTTSTWSGAYARPPTASMVELQPNSLFTKIMTDASDYIASQSEGTYLANVTAYAKVFQSCLAFENRSQHDVAVRISFIYVPNTTRISTAEPQAQDQPYTNIKYKGIFKRGIHSYNGPLVDNFNPASKVIATKRFILKTTRSLYDVMGSTTDDEITKPLREVTLTKRYKSRGQKLIFNSSSPGRPADSGNVYLCVTTNAVNTTPGATIGVRMWGIAGCELTMNQPTQKTYQ